MSVVNAEQAEFWEETAPTWVELADLFELVGAEPGRLAMERLELAGGERVLDVGCGTGPTTLELATRVGTAGRVVGLDISAGMLAEARARAERLGVANVEFRLADVQAEELGAAEHDACFSRFGVMFFSDPVAAFTNIRRALRPGGTLAFVCWQTVFDNEWMLVPGMAAMSVTGTLPPMPGPDEPGPFAFAEPEKIHSILGRAGFEEVDVHRHNDVVTGPESLVPRIVELSTRMGAAREALREAEELRPRVEEAVGQALREHVGDGMLRLSRAVHLVRARVAGG